MLTIVLTLLLAIANYLQAALVCPEVPSEGPVDLVVFHREQSRRYIGAFLVLCILALIANFVFGTMQGASEWGAQNLAVVPMVIAAALATIFRARWVQIGVVPIVSAPAGSGISASSQSGMG